MEQAIAERKDGLVRQTTDEIKVELIPSLESDEAFSNRTHEVQQIIKRVILIARKRGRPSMKEEEYEQAA